MYAYLPEIWNTIWNTPSSLRSKEWIPLTVPVGRYSHPHDVTVYFENIFIILAGKRFPLDYYCMWQQLLAEFQQKQPPKEQLHKSKAVREMSQHVGEKCHRKTLSIHSGEAPMLTFLNTSKSSVTEVIPLLPHMGVL